MPLTSLSCCPPPNTACGTVQAIRVLPLPNGQTAVYVQYKGQNNWVRLSLNAAIPSLQEVSAVDPNIVKPASSFENAHFYLRAGDTANTTTGYYTNSNGGGIQSGNTNGPAPLNLQPEGGRLTYNGKEVATTDMIPPTPDLQQVSDVGNKTTQSIIAGVGGGGGNTTIGTLGAKVRIYEPAGGWARGYTVERVVGEVTADQVTLGGYGGANGMNYGYISSKLSNPYNGADIKFVADKVGIGLTGTIIPSFNLEVNGNARIADMPDSTGNFVTANTNGVLGIREPAEVAADIGAITSETDPTVPAYVKAITQGNIENWNKAFSWGNHATAGYESQSNKATTLTGANNTTYPTTQAVSNALSMAVANYVPLSQKGIANGVATLGTDGKIPNSQIPAVAISETFVVNSQAAMLALSDAETGDVAVRIDISKSFILIQGPPSTLANWQELLTPTAPATNLSLGAATGTTRAINNSNGTGVTLPAVTTSLAGLMTATDKVKLNGLDSTLYASVSRTITAGNGLTGGGDLSANRTVTMGVPSPITSTSTNGVTATSHTHELAANAVTTAKIANAAVTNDKINTVSWSKVIDAPNVPSVNDYVSTDPTSTNSSTANFSGDLDSISGMNAFWYNTNAQNKPPFVSAGGMITNYKFSGGGGFQLIAGWDDETLGYRSFATNGVPRPWHQIASRDWVTSQIPTVNNGPLTLATSGIATGSASFTANQSTASSFTVNVPGTNLGSSLTGNNLTVTSSTGTNTTVDLSGIIPAIPNFQQVTDVGDTSTNSLVVEQMTLSNTADEKHDGALLIERTLNDAGGLTNARGIRDATFFSRTGRGYAAFDDRVTLGGDIDHHTAFQALPFLNGNTKVGEVEGFLFGLWSNNPSDWTPGDIGAVEAISIEAAHINAINGRRNIANTSYAIRIMGRQDQDGLGSSNPFSLWSNGSDKMYHWGDAGFGSLPQLGYKLSVLGNTNLDGTITSSSLAGTGTRMVVAGAGGQVSTQAIPSFTTPDLQEVTDVNNVTDNAVRVTGNTNPSASTDGLILDYDPVSNGGTAALKVNGTTVFLSDSTTIGMIAPDNPTTGLVLSGNFIQLLANGATLFALDGTNNIALFNTRVQGLDAVNNNEFVTLGQIPSVPTVNDYVSTDPAANNPSSANFMGDLNTVSGMNAFWYNTNAQNKPPFVSAGGMMTNYKFTGGGGFQLASGWGNEGLGYRGFATNGTPGNWYKIASEDWVTSQGYTNNAGTVTSVSIGNGLTGPSPITNTGIIHLGTPSSITLSSTNSLTSNSHTHAFQPGGTTAQYIRGDGTLAAFPTIPATPSLQQVLNTGNVATGVNGTEIAGANGTVSDIFTVKTTAANTGLFMRNATGSAGIFVPHLAGRSNNGNTGFQISASGSTNTGGVNGVMTFSSYASNLVDGLIGGKAFVFRNGNSEVVNIDYSGAITSTNLSGTGNRMVIANSGGTLSTQALPTAYTGSTSITLSGNTFTRPALTGDVTAAANSNVLTIANNAVTNAKINDVAWSKVTGAPAIPTNYVTTNSSQSGIQGAKSWTGQHTFGNAMVLSAFAGQGDRMLVTDNTGKVGIKDIPEPGWTDELGYGYEGNESSIANGLDTRGGYASRTQILQSGTSNTLNSNVEHVVLLENDGAILSLSNPASYPDRLITISNNSNGDRIEFTGSFLPELATGADIIDLQPGGTVSLTPLPYSITIKSVNSRWFVVDLAHQLHG